MRASSKNRFNSSGSFTTLIFVLLLAYFSYHAFSGDRGLFALIELSRAVGDASLKLDAVNAEKLKLEHKVSLLRNESLDLDLLDEQARNLLGYIGKKETLYKVGSE